MQGDDSAAVVGQTVGLIKDNAQRLGLTWQRKTGEVTGIDPVTGRLLVQYDGDTEPIPMVSMIGSALPVGARVYVDEVPPSGNFITGLVANGSLRAFGTAVGEFSAATAGTTTSATLVPMPGSPSVTFVKRWKDTAVRFGFDCTFFATGGADAGCQFSLRTSGGINVPVARLNAANGTNATRQQASGRATRAASVFAAGSYTFTAYWFRTAGAGTLNVAVDDWLSFEIVEYLA